jgi:hypothetical protein
MRRALRDAERGDFVDLGSFSELVDSKAAG